MAVPDEELAFLKTAIKLGEIPKDEAKKCLKLLKKGNGTSAADLAKEMGLLSSSGRERVEAAIAKKKKKKKNEKNGKNENEKNEKKKKKESKEPKGKGKGKGKEDSDQELETDSDSQATPVGADAPPPPSGNKKPILAGLAALFVLTIAVGIAGGLSFFAGGDGEKVEVQQAAAGAPKAPSEAAAPAPVEVETDDPVSPSGAMSMATSTRTRSNPMAKLAIRMAGRLQDTQDEVSALGILEDYLREEGKDAAVLEAHANLLAHCGQLLEVESARIRKLAAQGKTVESKRVLAALRDRLPEQLHDRLYELAQAVDSGAAPAPPTPEAASTASKPPVEQEETKPNDPNLFTYQLLERNLKDDDAEAIYKLGLWAKERNLHTQARECFERVVALDGFHQKARTALGHKLHKGRWYSDEEYKKDVLGWVKDKAGKWVDPKDIATREHAKGPKKPTGAKPKAGKIPLPPPAPYAEEDEAWYDDNEAECSFEDAPEYKSKYYLIKTNIKKEYAERYSKMMDHYFKRFRTVFKDFLGGTRYQKSEIWIYASHKEFMQSTGMGPGTGGFYHPLTKRVTAYHGRFGAQGTTRDVLAHEGTHQFQDIVLKGKLFNAPIWIIEGLAVFFESAYYDGEDVKIGLIPRQRLWVLKNYHATGTLFSLRDLIRTPKHRFTGKHYAHAWSLIYMVLYYGGSAKVRKRCQKWFSELFADALKRPVTWRQVEEKLGGKSKLLELEQVWQAWLKDLPYEFDPKKDLKN